MKTPEENKCGMECIRTNVERICVKPEKGQCPRCEQLVSECLARIRQLESCLAQVEKERDFKDRCLEWRYNDLERAEKLIEELEGELRQVERERDSAISDMRKAVKENGVCIACKHDIPFDENCEANHYRCEICKSPCMCQSCHLGSNYEWRGVCPENSKEE